MYTGVTSVVSDESNIGFILSNQRTKETRFYLVAGAKEYSAMDSAEGEVQNLRYTATFPLLLNISDQPTYFMALKDAAELVKMYAMVNVSQYQIVATGSEVKKGLIQDTFTPVVKAKLAAYGIETISIAYSGDGVENVANAIGEARKTGADLILCTGGMSVDPDDNTPGGIQASGARIVTYGAPVLPGAMFLLGYVPTERGRVPVLGLPGCVMYYKASIFELVVPRLLAGLEVTAEDIAGMGHGGFCSGCGECRYPICPFGK